MEIAVSGVIDRPVGEVFRFFADEHVRNHPRWDPYIRLEADGPLEVGSIVRRTNTRSGTAVQGTMEVVEYERDSSFGVVTREGSLEIHGRATFEAQDQHRTLLTLSVEMPDMDDASRAAVTANMQGSVDRIRELLRPATPQHDG